MTRFESKFLSNKRGLILPKFKDPFEGVERSGDRLTVEVRGTAVRWAKAGLSRLLTQFSSNVDILIITPYRLPREGETRKQTQDINDANFREFPRLLRNMLGTTKVGAFELWVHWTERGDDGTSFEVLSRWWVFINGDRNVSEKDFLAAAQALGRRFEQAAFIIRLNGVCSLELTTGGAMELTKGEAIEHALFEIMKVTGEFERWELVKEGDPKKPGSDYPVLIRENPSEEFPTATFVSVVMSMGDMKYFAHLGIDHPGWPW